MPRMHPQLRPIMQPPVAGRTGKAPPPPVGPPGSFGGGRVSLDNALVAVVGVGAPLCDTPPATAPHPTMKTNKPAPARNAIAVLPMFITTPTVGSQHDMRISETSPHGPAPPGGCLYRRVRLASRAAQEGHRRHSLPSAWPTPRRARAPEKTRQRAAGVVLRTRCRLESRPKRDRRRVGGSRSIHAVKPK